MKKAFTIKLRAPRQSDADAVDQLFRRPETAKYTNLPSQIEGGAGERFVVHACSQESWPNCVVHIIESAETEFVGIIVLENDPLCESLGGKENSSRLVYYWIEPQFWGKGIATAALKMLLEWAFGPPLRLDVIVACVKPDNAASIRVLEKSDFLEIEQTQNDVAIFHRLKSNQSVS